MGRIAGIAGVCLLLGLITGGWLWLRSPAPDIVVAVEGGPAGLEQSPAAGRAGSDASTPLVRDVDTSGSGGLEPALAVGHGRLIGRVQTVRPLSEVSVRVLWPETVVQRLAPAGFDAELLTAQTLRLAEDGAFISDGLPAVPGAQLMVTAVGGASLERRIMLAAGETTDVGTLVLGGGGIVRGRVIDRVRGVPVPGARIVEAGETRVTCDDDGIFECVGLPAGTWWFHAEADGMASGLAAMVALDDGATRDDVVLTVEPAVTLNGRVEDEEGRGLSGVLVSALVERHESIEHWARVPRQHRPAIEPVTSDDDGAFQIAPLPRGRVMLRASRAGYDTEALRFDSDEQDVRIVLEGVRTVEGRVIFADSGEPAPLSRASLEQRREDGTWRITANQAASATGPLANGSFALRIRNGTMRVLVTGPDFVRTVSSPFDVDDETPTVGPLVLEVQDGVRARGRVVDDEGRPVPGARVTFLEEHDTSDLRPQRDISLAPVASLADGSFESPPLARGTYQVRAQAEGFLGRAESACVVGSDAVEDVDLVLSRGGWILATVEPLGAGHGSFLEVRAYPVGEAGDEQRPRVRLVEGSTARVGPLEAGTYRVALATRREPERRSRTSFRGEWETTEAAPDAITLDDVVVAPGQETPVTLDLREGGQARVHGRLFRDGLAWPFGRVRVETTEGARATVLTDAAGDFLLEGPFGGGEIIVSGGLDDRSPFLVFVSVSLEDGADRSVDLHIDTGELVGEVVAADTAQPLRGVEVRFELLDAGVGPERVRLRQVQTDESGRFAAADIPSGRLRVQFSQRYRATVTKEQTLAAGGRLDLGTIELTPTGTVVLRIVDANGSRVREEVQVRAEGVDGGSVVEQSGRRGTVYLNGLVPGDYNLRVDGPGWSWDGQATVRSGGNVNVEVTR